MRTVAKQSGMTLMEMMAAVTVLMILTAIIAQVFFSATQASSKGKALAEVYQVARALKNVMARDFSGATPDAFMSAENGLAMPFVSGLPPGPYSMDLFPTPPYSGSQQDAFMRRMLMGGSDYAAFTSANAATSDKAVAKVFYVLRASGELVRIVHADTVYTAMNYSFDAMEKIGSDVNNPIVFEDYEAQHVLAPGIRRMKFSFLDRGQGPVSTSAGTLGGVWVDSWDWDARRYLPAAVKVELQIVDHLWNISDGDVLTGRNFDPARMDDDFLTNTTGAPPPDGLADNPEAGELFDPDDGEPFTFIIDVPLGMKAPGA